MDEETGIRHRALTLLREGASYAEIARLLGVRPGLAYMLVTGIPADGSDSLSPEDLRREGLLASSQHLANPPVDHPASKDSTLAFVRRRAAIGLDPVGGSSGERLPR
jgi:hypothetical protein